MARLIHLDVLSKVLSLKQWPAQPLQGSGVTDCRGACVRPLSSSSSAVTPQIEPPLLASHSNPEPIPSKPILSTLSDVQRPLSPSTNIGFNHGDRPNTASWPIMQIVQTVQTAQAKPDSSSWPWPRLLGEGIKTSLSARSRNSWRPCLDHGRWHWFGPAIRIHRCPREAKHLQR